MDRQEAALAAWLVAHPEYELAERLVDAGVSAGRGKHRLTGALSRFIQGGRNGTVPRGSCLVVESLTRFSREAERSVLETLLRDVWGQGLALAICADGGVVLTGELIDLEPHRLYGLLGSISQARREWEERSNRAKGATAKARLIQDQGSRTDGFTPWWIARDVNRRLIRSPDGGLTVDPAARAAIERAAELALSGMGTTLIASTLDEEGFPPPPTGHARNQYGNNVCRGWNHSRVSTLLASPALIGTRVRREAPAIPGYYPAVLSQERWAELRSAVATRDTMRGQLRGGSRKCHNLFATVSRCAECGGPISFHPPAREARGNHPGWVGCRAGNGRTESSCSNAGYIFTNEFENHCLTRLHTTVWEALLARPEDDAEHHKLGQQLGDLALHRDLLHQQLAAAEKRAEQAWLDNVDSERQATIERALGRLRQQLEAATVGHDKAAQQLAAMRSRPSGYEAAKELRDRVADAWTRLRSRAVSNEELTEQLVRAQEANGEPSPTAKVLAERVAQLREAENIPAPNDRRDFNRWLLTRDPPIRLLLHPGRQIELSVGGESLGLREIDPLCDSIVVKSGALGVDLDEAFPDGAVIVQAGTVFRTLRDVIEAFDEARVSDRPGKSTPNP